MKRVLTSEQMKLCDTNAIERGIPSLTLMENAATAIMEEFLKIYSNGRIAIICGGGNNGGDGAAIARLLFEKGISCDVYFYFNNMSKDCSTNFERLKTLPINMYVNSDITDFNGYAYIIDAIFGTGISRKAEGLYKALIDGINRSDADITSVDMPSGLFLGSASDEAVVKANRTVTLAAYKYGQLFKGKDCCGNIIIKDIGIATNCGGFVYENTDIRSFFPKRALKTHKGSYGKLTLIAGSGKYFGAALISHNSAASLLTGTGLASLAVPRFLAPSYRKHIKESVLEYLPDNGENAVFDYGILKNIMSGSNAICIGMGMGCNEETYKICKTLIEEYDKKLLLDADALNSLSAYGDRLFQKKRFCDIVITPHLKEFSRLSGIKISKLSENPLPFAQAYAKENNITVLLKGSTTIITDGNITALNLTGTPAMAKAGSGDVLSGIIGGLLAQGHSVFDSAVSGAYIHGKAGEYAAMSKGEYSVLASDICKNIPCVIKEL